MPRISIFCVPRMSMYIVCIVGSACVCCVSVCVCERERVSSGRGCVPRMSFFCEMYSACIVGSVCVYVCVCGSLSLSLSLSLFLSLSLSLSVWLKGGD